MRACSTPAKVCQLVTTSTGRAFLRYEGIADLLYDVPLIVAATAPDLRPHGAFRHAGVAQQVEQLICNQLRPSPLDLSQLRLHRWRKAVNALTTCQSRAASALTLEAHRHRLQVCHRIF